MVAVVVLGAVDGRVGLIEVFTVGRDGAAEAVAVAVGLGFVRMSR